MTSKLTHTEKSRQLLRKISVERQQEEKQRREYQKFKPVEDKNVAEVKNFAEKRRKTLSQSELDALDGLTHVNNTFCGSAAPIVLTGVCINCNESVRGDDGKITEEWKKTFSVHPRCAVLCSKAIRKYDVYEKQWYCYLWHKGGWCKLAGFERTDNGRTIPCRSVNFMKKEWFQDIHPEAFKAAKSACLNCGEIKAYPWEGHPSWLMACAKQDPKL